MYSETLLEVERNRLVYGLLDGSSHISGCIYLTEIERVILRCTNCRCVASSDVTKVTRSWFMMEFDDSSWSTAMMSRSAQSALVYPKPPQFCEYAQWLWTAKSADVIYCRVNITRKFNYAVSIGNPPSATNKHSTSLVSPWGFGSSDAR